MAAERCSTTSIPIVRVINGSGTLFSHHNLNSVDPSAMILGFSESLEADLSNGTNVYI